jgi:hypothetical protein
VSLSTVITYDTAGQFIFDSTLVEVSGGTIRLLDLGGATYSTANPAITTSQNLSFNALSSFAESSSVSGSDLVKYQLIINGTSYYWSTTWQAADGTYATTSTAAQINTNRATLFSDLSLPTGPLYLSLRVFLHSATGATRPTLTSNTLGYTFLSPSATSITQVVVYGYLKDLLGVAQAGSSTQPILFHVKSDKAYMHGNTLVEPFDKTATVDATGYFSLSVNETETPGKKLQFFITYYEGISRKSIQFVNAVIPNTPTNALSSFTQVRSVDFG